MIIYLLVSSHFGPEFGRKLFSMFGPVKPASTYNSVAECYIKWR